MSESARCSGGWWSWLLPCKCCTTQAMLTSSQGEVFLMRDDEGNVMIDSKSKVPLCVCGHPVHWHPPGSASTQTQVTENPMARFPFPTNAFHPLPDVGQVWQVPHLNEGGLRGVERGLYVREESKLVWNKLQALRRGGNIVLKGPPGIGKSSEVFGWAMYQVARNTQSVLWIHFDSPTTMVVLRASQDEMWSTVFKTKDISLNFGVVQSLILASTCHIVVIDGLSMQSFSFENYIGSLLCIRKELTFVACSSQQVPIVSSELYVSVGGVDYYNACSWTLRELQEGRSAGVWGDVTEEYIESRYFLSGGNVRFLIGYTEDGVRAHLHEKLNMVSDMTKLLSGTLGSGSHDAVNHLLSLRRTGKGDKASIISQYVWRELANCVDDAFFIQADTFGQKNPAFRGWIFEFRLLHKLKNSNHVSCDLLSSDNSLFISVEIPITNMFDYSSQFTSDYFAKSTAQGGLYLITPSAWNQGCFDFVLYRLEDNIRTFYFCNATVAEKHDFRCDAMFKFLALALGYPPRNQCFNNVRVLLVAVRPSCDKDTNVQFTMDNEIVIQTTFDPNFSFHVAHTTF